VRGRCGGDLYRFVYEVWEGGGWGGCRTQVKEFMLIQIKMIGFSLSILFSSLLITTRVPLLGAKSTSLDRVKWAMPTSLSERKILSEREQKLSGGMGLII